MMKRFCKKVGEKRHSQSTTDSWMLAKIQAGRNVLQQYFISNNEITSSRSLRQVIGSISLSVGTRIRLHVHVDLLGACLLNSNSNKWNEN